MFYNSNILNLVRRKPPHIFNYTDPIQKVNSYGKKLLDQLSDALRTQHYSYRTEETYIDWVRRYTLRVFHKKRQPKDMGVEEIQALISHLATERRLSASSQNPCTEPVEGHFLQRGGLAVKSPLDS